MQYDHVLYQLGNESNHAFVVRALPRLGGTVVLHDWVLFDMALAAYPAIARGGPKGAALVLREGGLGQLARYVRNFADRRVQKRRPEREPDHTSLVGEILAGWHAPEDRGRWTCDFGSFRVPDPDADALEVEFHAPPGRTVTLWRDGERLAGFVTTPQCADTTFEIELHRPSDAPFVLRADPVVVTDEQRRYGDSRRLGTFVKSIRYRSGEAWREVGLALPPAHHTIPVTLSRDRFDLPLNGSVLRHADSFIVHSDYVGDRIRAERGDHVQVGRVWHGAEDRSDDRDRRDVRSALGLPGAWRDDFVVVSFGGVQPHKRIDKLLDGLVLARRERPDIRLVLAGKVAGDFFDAADEVRRRHLDDAVRLTGFVPEEIGWEWLRAGDLSVNLRGPTSGGTSGGIFQSFGLGRAVIASDAAEQRELPDECTLKVPLGEGEVEAIARTLVDLRDHPEKRDALERAVRRFVATECHWRIQAEHYLELLERFRPPRSSGRSRPLVATT
ncbi:MAG: glycosyltransferase family 4 protein [Planctomycetota bacterium]